MTAGKRRPRRAHDMQPPSSEGPPGPLRRAWRRIEPWYPWTVAGLLLAVMGYLALRYHTVGGMGVETDFYAELCPPARDLLEGRFSPLNYSAKGPVYSFLLAGMYLVVRDFFTAGVVLNLLSSAGFIVVLYFLVRTVFNSAAAAVTVFAVMVNYTFLQYTYQAGSDIPFILLSAASILFLFRDGGRRDLILSAVFGLLAFLTRYNGAFIVAGTVLYLAVAGEGWKYRMRRIGLWLGVFFVAGLPWFIPNWIATGSPIKNANYVNVMMDFYALGKGANYENWTDALPKNFTGMGDIFVYDPVYFVRHWAGNVAKQLLFDMRDLTGYATASFFVFGMLALAMVRPVKRRLLYLAFGVFYICILALVFYNSRFSLFLLAVYIPFAVWPFTVRVRPDYLHWVFRGLLVVFLVITAYSVPKTLAEVNTRLRDVPIFLRELGVALGEVELDKSQTIIARKPHVAFYAGLKPSMLPDKPATIDELVSFCRSNNVRYILYSAIEAQARPQFADLARYQDKHPGLTLVCYNNLGIIYRVE